MIKKSVTYKDFDENEVTKDFWFHLNEGDLMAIQMSKKQGFFESMEIAQQNDDPTIVMEAFQKILVNGVGRREGELFIKDDTARNQLIYTNAYSALVVWMLANPVEANTFVNGFLPKEAQDAIVDSKDELVVKMRERLAEKIAEVELKDVSVNVEASPAGPIEVIEEAGAEFAQAAPEAPVPDFSAMTPEEFTAWQASQA